MVQERRDQGSVQIVDVQVRDGFAGLGAGEYQQQAQGVAVGSDRVRAGPPLLDQPLGEERLQTPRDGGHRPSPPGGVPSGWSRRAAWAISSGAAWRYQ
jgi:hypothetical protein